RLSPDGTRLTVQRIDASGQSDIWIHDLNRVTWTKLTAAPVSSQQPVWSPDGSRIAFAVGAGTFGPATIFQKASTGIGAEDVLLKLDASGAPDDWAEDAMLYHFGQFGFVTGVTSLMLLPFDGDRKPRAVVASRFVAADGRFSPDRKWMAYVSTESG